MRINNEKKMKRSVMIMGLMVLVASVLSSCKKNDIDDTGQFRLKVVNASPGSAPQTFTLAGKLLVGNGLSFPNATDYISSESGTRLVAEFKNPNGSIYASGEIFTANSIIQTVYLVGQGSKARVKYFTDDLSTPNSGKVKIKFIHFSDNAPANLRIKDSTGADLQNNITRNEDTGYKFVDPGVLSIQLISTSSGNSLGTFSISDLQSGKIYDLYFTDDADGKLVVNKVLHN